ncbi:hypothetical protein N7468_001178 [Penicillium chermesinum]|uniref:Uncharacterized protein n=1 Tax=Penicillium chermesinum TaxID=63820 RepID=A0A9W9PG89_9EURO|nr:uncharacterized protein N7468_001178 [Penicillium chermesinum]KAJ5246195.1 hypothetical protein N7468_001178 [Penicillium chermesinum]
MAESSATVEEGASSENPLAGMIDPTAVRLAYKRMPNTGDKALPQNPKNMPEGIRRTYDLEMNELIAVINCRVKFRKQFLDIFCGYLSAVYALSSLMTIWTRRSASPTDQVR